MDDFLPNKLNAKISNFSGGTLRSTRNSLQNYLFRSSEPGFTFEPWDMTTLYQDRAGTTPVTAVGQSVGLRLSKDKGLALGSEVGSISSGWAAYGATPATVAYSSGVTITNNGTTGGGSFAFASVIGRWYRIAVTIGNGSGLSERLRVGNSVGGLELYNQLAGGATTIHVAATATTTYVNIAQTSANLGAVTTVSSFSVRELAGNHEVAINDAARGVYGREPKTGKRNLLTYTEQFDNAVWTKTNTTVTTDATAAPDGTNTADKLSETATTASHYAYETYTSTGVRIVYSVYAKAAERRRIAVWEGTTSANGAVFDLISGTVVNNLAAGVGSIQSVGDGWYRCSVTSIETAGTRWLVCSVLLDDATGVGGTVGVAGSGIYIWGAQLELGSTATAYQRVASQYDITEAGVPTCYYVQADGVDDAYVTPTITPNTDKVQVFAGVRKLSDSPQGHILGGNGNTSGQFETLSGGWSIAANRYGAGFFTDAISQIDSPESFTPPRSDVLSWRFDMAGATGADKVKLNVSGISQTLSIAGVPAQGNFGAFAHYIYSRAGTSLPFNGLDFGHAVRFGPNLDAATIARVEALIARNTPEVTL